MGEGDWMDLEEPNDGQPSSLAPNAPRAPSPFFASPPAERIGPPSGVLVDVGRPYSPGPSLGSTQPPQAHPVPNQCQPSHGHPIPEDEFSEAEIVFDSPTTSMENIRARDPKQPLMSSPFTQTSPQTLSFQAPQMNTNHAPHSSLPNNALYSPHAFAQHGFQSSYASTYGAPSTSAPAAIAPVAMMSDVSYVPKRRASQPVSYGHAPYISGPISASGFAFKSPLSPIASAQATPATPAKRRHSHSGRVRRNTSTEMSSELDVTNDHDGEDVEEEDGEWDSNMDLDSEDDGSLASSPTHSASIVTPPSRNLPDPPPSFKLPVSKSPIMDALCYCALQGWGMRVLVNRKATATSPAEVIFRVDDFERYYRISRSICSKQTPTEDIGARVKALRRWFSNFPAKRERSDSPFDLTVRQNGVRKVRQLLEENARLLNLI